MVPRDGAGATILVDTSITHITSVTAIAASSAFHLGVLQQERIDFTNNTPTATNLQTPQVAKVVKKKEEKYGLLEKLLNVHGALNGTARTKFVAAVLSHRGELAGGFMDLMEAITLKFRRNERGNDNIDGLSPARASALFRSDFKAKVFVALTKGWGMQMLATGFYRGSRKGGRVV